MAVTIYTTSICPYCEMAKEFFHDNKVAFTEINVQQDRSKIPEMIEKSGQTGVPVIDVNGTIIIGFNEGKLHELLKLKD